MQLLDVPHGTMNKDRLTASCLLECIMLVRVHPLVCSCTTTVEYISYSPGYCMSEHHKLYQSATALFGYPPCSWLTVDALPMLGSHDRRTLPCCGCLICWSSGHRCSGGCHDNRPTRSAPRWGDRAPAYRAACRGRSCVAPNWQQQTSHRMCPPEPACRLQIRTACFASAASRPYAGGTLVWSVCDDHCTYLHLCCKAAPVLMSREEVHRGRNTQTRVSAADIIL